MLNKLFNRAREDNLKKTLLLLCLICIIFSGCIFRKNTEIKLKIENQENQIEELKKRIASLKEGHDLQLENQAQELDKIKHFISLINAKLEEDIVTRFVSPFIPQKLEFCGEEVPLTKFQVKERLEQVLLWEMNRLGMCLVFLRSGRWFSMIEKEIQNQGLPDDLKYLAVIESDLNVEAHSYAGAVGLWQFIASTARNQCGLTINYYIDERLDSQKSTNAALKHLKELYQEFGNWTSALAGYNMHKDRYERERVKERALGFYEVKDIPEETLQYPFRAIAVKLIMENPEKYGFPSWEKINKVKYSPYSIQPVTITVSKYRERIVEIAERYGMTYYEFRVFNPHILIRRNRYKEVIRNYLPRGKYRIYVKKGTE